MARVAALESRPLVGAFDFAHHQAIHKHIFSDVYEWAGENAMVTGRSDQFADFLRPAILHRGNDERGDSQLVPSPNPRP